MRERVGETPGRRELRGGGQGGAERDEQLYAKTVGPEQTIGCSGPLSYTHDDIAPDKPVVTRMRLAKGALTSSGAPSLGAP